MQHSLRNGKCRKKSIKYKKRSFDLKTANNYFSNRKNEYEVPPLLIPLCLHR